MADFKMVENRKYNDEEIRYVVSRVHAGWDPAIIAKAFKQDHGEYWADREFTKKQVAYIRSTYKPPPGVVKPYNGPIPEFSRSSTPEDSPRPTSTAGYKRKQAVGFAQNRCLSNQTPMYEQAGSPIAGPSRKRQKTQALRDTPNLQGGLGEDQGQDQGFISPSDPLRSINDVRDERIPPELSNFDDIVGEDFDWENYGIGAEEDPALRNPSLVPSSPGMMLPGANLDQGSTNLPDFPNLFPDVPVQSIETHRSVAPGPGTNATNSAVPTPPQQQQEHPQQGTHNPQAQFPPPYSQRGAVARDDPYGVWYFNPHDTCQIWLGHRHDFDGGVWFTSEMCVWQSLIAMQHTEGIGFMLGVAAAAQQILNADIGRYLNDRRRGVDPQDLMRQAARIVREHIPEHLLDDDSFEVPDPTDIARLMETNRRLPAGNFYDPFHRRLVEYDMSGRGGTGGNGQQDGGPGPSRQREGQGEGAAGSSGPSRQGTGAPLVHRSPRQRTDTPRNGKQRAYTPQSLRPSHQGTGIPLSGRNLFQGTGTRSTVGSLRPARQGTSAPGVPNS